MSIRTLLTSAAILTIAALAPASAVQKAAPPHHATAKQAHLVIINTDLDFKPKKRSDYGRLLGYDPVEVHVHLGDRIQFVNVDDENHASTGMTYTGQQAPKNYTFSSDYTQRRGHIIDNSEWSTGTLRAHGGKSQIFTTKQPGHYFYACGYHQTQGMIGVIVVTP